MSGDAWDALADRMDAMGHIVPVTYLDACPTCNTRPCVCEPAKRRRELAKLRERDRGRPRDRAGFFRD